jgi:signal transduction histidine kinase
MRPKPSSLQSKIIVIISITVIIVVGVSTYIAAWLTREPVEEEIYRKAVSQAELTAHQLGDREVLRAPEKMARTLRQTENDLPGIVQSDVYLHEPVHHLLITTKPDGEHLELDNTRNIEAYNEYFRPNEDQITIETPKGDYWILNTPLRDQNRVVGCLNLKVSKSRSNVITLDLVKRNLMLLTASLAALLVVIHLFFLKSIRHPVREMVRVMEATESGQLDARARVESTDEIGQLAEHLNLMLRRVENFQAELEHKVQEATSELARANQELKRINEELFETQKNLARSERLAVAGQLAASLAHEIGTPLNSISGHVQLLARRKGVDEVSLRRLGTIENQIESIVRTVKQLLSSTRKFDLKIEPVDLRRVVKDAILLSSPSLQHRKIKVHMDLPRDCPSIYGDAIYLQQVFLNFINNSMDAMQDGGSLSFRLRYAEESDRPDSSETASDKLSVRFVTVEVSDTGYGISKETLAHIFEPMFTTKRIGTGAGLGLAICDQIVRQHGGSIHVTSEAGKGTCFAVTLPIDCRKRRRGPAQVMPQGSAARA